MDASPVLPNIDEYKSLRDETLKRVDARNQLLSYTLAFAASMFTLGLGSTAYASALLIYPIVAFFFATSFAYNSLLLIEIGAYLRSVEAEIPGLGWATHLKPRYASIELFELVATAGLFLGTEFIGLFLYESLDVAKKTAPTVVATLGWCAFGLTIVSVVYPWTYHRRVLKRS